MQHLQILNITQRGVRATVCTKCSHRPQGSETLGPEVRRECESNCTIFANLPHLIRIAWDGRGQLTAPYEHAMRELVCTGCGASPTAGDFCIEGITRTCPLSRHVADVVKVIESLLPPKKAAV